MIYYPFHVSDYLVDTSHLNLMENLAYRLLLDRYYLNEKPIESDIKKLSRLIRMQDFEKEIGQVLKEFFLESKDGWRNIRADKEIERYHKNADISRTNGKKGGRPKKPNRNPVGSQQEPSSNPVITHEQPESEPEPEPEPINNKNLKTQKNNTKKENSKISFENLPSEIEKSAAIEFINSRKSIKKPVTQSIFDRQMENAVKIGYDKSNEYTANQVVLMAVDNGWQGINAKYYLSRKGEKTHEKQELDWDKWR